MTAEFTIAELASLLNAPFEGDGTLTVSRVCEPKDARGQGDLALAMDPKFGEGLHDCKVDVAILWHGADWQAYDLKAAILVSRGRLAMAGVTKAFDPGLGLSKGIHAAAIISPSAQISDSASIGPFVVIGDHVKIGKNAQIASHVTIASHSEIGDDALLHSSVKIGTSVQIGDRFIAQAGAVIGADGFSYVTVEKSAVEQARESLGAAVEAQGQEWTKIASIGGVHIGDDVEIGANSTVDHGTIRATQIGTGTKLDNLVHVGHNVVIGQHCLLCGQSGIAGSTIVGDYVVMGGQSGAADNLKIGKGAIIGAGTGVLSNVSAGKAMMGTPAVPMQTNIEMYKALRRLPRILDKLRNKDS